MAVDRTPKHPSVLSKASRHRWWPGRGRRIAPAPLPRRILDARERSLAGRARDAQVGLGVVEAVLVRVPHRLPRLRAHDEVVQVETPLLAVQPRQSGDGVVRVVLDQDAPAVGPTSSASSSSITATYPRVRGIPVIARSSPADRVRGALTCARTRSTQDNTVGRRTRLLAPYQAGRGYRRVPARTSPRS